MGRLGDLELMIVRVCRWMGCCSCCVVVLVSFLLRVFLWCLVLRLVVSEFLSSISCSGFFLRCGC